MIHAPLLALALVAGLPADEDVAAALADAKTLPEGAAAQVRYLSLSTVPPADRAEAAAVVSFALQHVSRSPVIVLPARVSDRLIRIDLAAVCPDPADLSEWSAVWESLGASEPYYHLRTAVLDPAAKPAPATEVYTDGGWLDLEAAAELRALTGSAVPIVDARWWVHHAMLPPLYYQFAGIPETRSAWYESLGLDPKLAEVGGQYAYRGANVVRSNVTGKPRAIERVAAPAGALWITFDSIRVDGVHDPFRDPTLTESFRYDAGEYIAARPNGFHEYFIADAAGKRVDVVDPFIATDQTLGLAGALQPAGSCVRCHTAAAGDDGLRPFTDQQGVLAERAGLQAAAPETAAKLANYYGRQDKLARDLDRDREDYGAAVAQATGGLSPQAAGQAFGRLDASYRALVTPEQATFELGMAAGGLETLVARTPEPVLHLLAVGYPVDRGQWESGFHAIAIAAVESATPPPPPEKPEEPSP